MYWKALIVGWSDHNDQSDWPVSKTVKISASSLPTSWGKSLLNGERPREDVLSDIYSPALSADTDYFTSHRNKHVQETISAFS